MPDTNARNLVTQSNRTIGILTDDIDTLHQVEGCHRVEYELMRNGYYCFVKYIGHGPDAIETAMLDLARHRVEVPSAWAARSAMPARSPARWNTTCPTRRWLWCIIR